MHHSFVDPRSSLSGLYEFKWRNTLFYCDKKWLSEKENRQYRFEVLPIVGGDTSCLSLIEKMDINRKKMLVSGFDLCVFSKSSSLKKSVDKFALKFPCSHYSKFLSENFNSDSFEEIAKLLAEKKLEQGKGKAETFEEKETKAVSNISKECNYSFGKYNQANINFPPFNYNYSCLFQEGLYESKLLQYGLYLTFVGSGIVATSLVGGLVSVIYQGQKNIRKRYKRKVQNKKVMIPGSIDSMHTKNTSKANRSRRRGRLAKFGALGALVGLGGSAMAVSQMLASEEKNKKDSFLEKEFIFLTRSKESMLNRYNSICK